MYDIIMHNGNMLVRKVTRNASNVSGTPNHTSIVAYAAESSVYINHIRIMITTRFDNEAYPTRVRVVALEDYS